MADITHDGGSHDAHTGTRRDFLNLTATALTVVGAASATWVVFDTLNPAADVRALSTIDVDLAPIAEGQAVTVMWRGKPLFVRRRTGEEIQAAAAVALDDLPDPQTDQERVKEGHAEWLVLVGVCTHLGCVPLGQKPTDPRGDYGGWFCPCHGSQYDTSGRVRIGPAPTNLEVPPYQFLSDSEIRVG